MKIAWKAFLSWLNGTLTGFNDFNFRISVGHISMETMVLRTIFF